MKYFIRLAWKNLMRHKLRTSVSIAAIAVSIIAVVFARGLIVGFIDSVFSDQIQYSSGHIRIVNQEYEQKERLLSLNYTIDGFKGKGAGSMIDRLESVAGVEMAVPRIKFGSVVSTGNELVKMVGWGVDPAKEIKFTDIDRQLVEGRMVQEGKKEVVMGAGLLTKLNKGVGDKVTVLYNTSFNSFKGTTFRIVGKIESDLKLLNDSVYYLPLARAQQMLFLENQVTDILLVTGGLNEVDSVTPLVTDLIKEQGGMDKYKIIPWDEAGGMVYYMKVARNIYNVIYVFLVILASFVVINTMVMIVKERTKEIGMMSALGLKSRQILGLFVMEGTFMGVVGSFLGALLGGVITRIIATTGIDYTEAMEGMGEEVIMSPVIYPVFSLQNMLFGFVLGVIVVTAACIIPARRAARLEPTEALREF